MATQCITAPTTKKLILAIWAHTETIRHHRNQKVLGSTVEDHNRMKREVLTRQVEAEYTAYQNDHFIIWAIYLSATLWRIDLKWIEIRYADG